jgi:pantoate--beta-alanine ligase
MDIVKTIDQIRKHVAAARSQGKTIGFVPTMGALHIGHASLIKAACERCDYVVVSIFVNPTQFGPSEDLDKYPRDLDADAKICSDCRADIIFAPTVAEMYPDELITWVDVEKITDCLCGESRPGHFRGVTTVCAKLFNIVSPDCAFFGQKDAQQIAVIKRMVADLNMPLDIVTCPTVRDKDGLATSSRNKYLTESQRKDALLISKSLLKCLQLIEKGNCDTALLKNEIRKTMTISPDIKVQYVAIVDTVTLQEIDSITDKALVAVAVTIGDTRLIDNILINLNNL